MKRITKLFVLGVLFSSFYSFSQFARVQVIHNSPDLAAAQVDVYINGSLELDNFAFRTATEFLNLPPNVSISIDVKASNSNGNPASPVLYNLTTTLEADETYILVANGIVSATGYTNPSSFAINVFAQGRESAAENTQTDVLVNHGSPDAPTVDVVETAVPAGTIVNNLSFPNFAGYLELPVLDFTLDITDETGADTVASFSAPLQTLNLGGAAITVLASGFLNPSANSNGPAFGLWVATANGGPLLELPVAAPNPEFARVQVIHNSPDLAAAEVDVYINDNLELDNFAFRTATEFLNLPAGVPLSIDVKASNSNGNPASPVLYNLTTTLNANETYILIANGIVSATGYTNPSSFAINVFAQGRESAAENTQTDVLVNHGSPDAPTVDVVETAVPAGTIVNNLSFPNFAGYLELPVLDFTLDITDETGADTVASFSAPLQTLNLGGAAITVLASGFLNPSANSNGPAFGLWVATANGGPLLQLPPASPDPQFARVQAIHNSPDLAAAQVDVYINGNLELDNFAFRTATEFVNLPAGVPLSIDVKASNSNGNPASPVLYNLTTTLDANETYILVANGIVSATGYTNPSSFAINVFAPGRESADANNQVDVLVVHGSPDAPTVDVVETAVPAGTIVNNLSFPNFAGYLELPVLDFVLDVRDETGSNTVASFLAPLQTLNLGGAAITVLASGFLNPTANSNGAPFGLWVATANGGPLQQLPVNPLNTLDFNVEDVTIYPNPSQGLINLNIPFSFDNVDVSIIDMNGREILSKNKNNTNTIDISSVEDGVYFVNLTIDNTNINKKIVLKK